MTPLEISERTFKAIQEIRDKIGVPGARFAKHRQMSKKTKVIAKYSHKYGLSEKHVAMVYWGIK